MEAVEDPRVHENICGVTRIGATGIEWICIKEPHDKEYKRHSRPGYSYGTGAHPEYANPMVRAPQAERHYMVNRWPNRKQTDG